VVEQNRNKEAAKEQPKEAAATTPAPATDPTANPDYEMDGIVVLKVDCLTCHKVDEKLIDLLTRDVANKYENTEAM